MLNYEVDASLLLPFVPAGTELDCWHGKIFASLVGFRFLKTRVLGFPCIPMHSNFDEVNLRCYVRRKEASEIRRGVVFIREIVPRRAIAFAARTFYNENYCAVPMSHEIEEIGNRLKVAYRWGAGDCRSEMSLETDGSSCVAVEDSMEQFITEHYWGYAAQRDGGCVEYRVEHPSWQVWQVRNAAFKGDGERFYGKEIASLLGWEPDSAFLAGGSPVTVMRGRRL